MAQGKPHQTKPNLKYSPYIGERCWVPAPDEEEIGLVTPRAQCSVPPLRARHWLRWVLPWKLPQKEDGLSLPSRSCSPAGSMQHGEKAGAEKGGRRLASRRRQTVPGPEE